MLIEDFCRRPEAGLNCIFDKPYNFQPRICEVKMQSREATVDKLFNRGTGAMFSEIE